MNVENATKLSVKMESEEFYQTLKDETNHRNETEDNAENIYDDICNFDLGEKIEQGNARIRELEEENKSLKQEVQSLKDAILVQKKIETTLTKNISSLFLTAKAEIARKDRQIAQLTEKLDNMYFRRKSGTWKPDDNIRKTTDGGKTERAEITDTEVVANGPIFDIEKVIDEGFENIPKTRQAGDKEDRKNEDVVVDLSYVPQKNENIFQNVNLEDVSRQRSASLEPRSNNKSVQDLREKLKEKESNHQHDKRSRKENVDCEDDNRMLDYRSNDRQDRRYRKVYGEDRFGGVQHWLEDFNRRGRYDDLDNRNRRNVYDERDRYYGGRRIDRRNTYGERENSWRNAYYDNDPRTPYEERGRYRRHYHEEQRSYNYDERNRRYCDENVERNDYEHVQRIQGDPERGTLRRDEKMNAEPADIREDFGMPRYQEDSIALDTHQTERLQEMRGYRNQEYDLYNDVAQRDTRRSRGQSVERCRARSRSRETYRRENGRRTKSVGPSRSYHMKESNHDKTDEFNPDSKINRARPNSFERESQIIKCNSEEQKVSSTTDKEILRAVEGNQRKPNASNEESLLHNQHIIETNISNHPAPLKTDLLYKHSDSSNNRNAEPAETNLKQDPKSKRKKLKMLTIVENDYRRKKLMPPSESCMDDTLLTTWDNSDSTCLNSWTEVSSPNITQLDKTTKQTQDKLTTLLAESSISLQIKPEETSTSHVCDSKKIVIGKSHEQVGTLFSKRQKLLLANRNAINNQCTIIEIKKVDSNKTEMSLPEKEQSVAECNKPTENKIDPNKEGINREIVNEEKSGHATEKTVETSKIIENPEKKVPNQKYEANNNKKELKTRSSKSETSTQDKKGIKENAENLSTKFILNYRIPKKKTGQAAIPQAKSEDHIAAKVYMTSTMEHKTFRAESSKRKSPKTPKRTSRCRVIDSDSDELEENTSSFFHEQKSKPKQVVAIANKSEIVPSLPTLSEFDANKQKDDRKKPIASGTVNDGDIYPVEDALNVDFHSQKKEENKESDVKKTIIVLSEVIISKDNTEVVLHRENLTQMQSPDQNVEAIKEIKDNIENTGIVECPDTSLNENKQDTSKEKIIKREIDKEVREKPTSRKRSKSTETKIKKTNNKLKTRTDSGNKEPANQGKSVENIKTDSLPILISSSNGGKKEGVEVRKVEDLSVNVLSSIGELITEMPILKASKNDDIQKVIEIIEDVSKDKKSRKDCNKQKELQNKPAKSIEGAESDCKVDYSANELTTTEVIKADFNMPQKATETVNDISKGKGPIKESEDNPAKRRKSNNTENKTTEANICTKKENCDIENRYKPRTRSTDENKEFTVENKAVKKIKTTGLPNLDISSNETEENVHQVTVEDLSLNFSSVAELTTIETRIIKGNESDDTKKVIDVVKYISKDKKTRMDCSKWKGLHEKPIKQTKSKSIEGATKEVDISRKQHCDSESHSRTKTKIDSSANELTTTEVIKTDINILQKAIETTDDMSKKNKPRNELNSKPTKRRKSNSTENKMKEANMSRKKESCDVENTYKLRTRSASENKEFTDENKQVKKIKIAGLPNLDISSNESEKEAVEKHCEKLSRNIINSVGGLAAAKTAETKTNETDVTVDKITEVVNITSTLKGIKRKRVSDSSSTVKNDLAEKVTKKHKEDIKMDATEVKNTSIEGTKKRITNLIPVKASSLYSFENILVKNQLPSFTERLSEQISVQLTDEGEIPLLHLEENHLNNLPQEDISKDDLLKLLENMSTIEPDAIKFKTTSDDSKQSLDSLKEYTFENFMTKASSTPIVNNSSQKISNNTVSKEKVSGDTKVVSSEQQQGALSNNISHNLDVNNSTKSLMSRVGRRRRCRLVRVE